MCSRAASEPAPSRTSALPETKAPGHPTFENLRVGERVTTRMVVVFIDLTTSLDAVFGTMRR